MPVLSYGMQNALPTSKLLRYWGDEARAPDHDYLCTMTLTPKYTIQQVILPFASLSCRNIASPNFSLHNDTGHN